MKLHYFKPNVFAFIALILSFSLIGCENDDFLNCEWATVTYNLDPEVYVELEVPQNIQYECPYGLGDSTLHLSGENTPIFNADIVKKNQLITDPSKIFRFFMYSEKEGTLYYYTGNYSQNHYIYFVNVPTGLKTYDIPRSGAFVSFTSTSDCNWDTSTNWLSSYVYFELSNFKIYIP